MVHGDCWSGSRRSVSRRLDKLCLIVEEAGVIGLRKTMVAHIPMEGGITVVIT